MKQGLFQNKRARWGGSKPQYFRNVGGSLKQWTHNSVRNIENGNRSQIKQRQQELETYSSNAFQKARSGAFEIVLKINGKPTGNNKNLIWMCLFSKATAAC